MKNFTVEIFGYIELQAESRRDAVLKVKDQFDRGVITHESLAIEATFEDECEGKEVDE